VDVSVERREVRLRRKRMQLFGILEKRTPWLETDAHNRGKIFQS